MYMHLKFDLSVYMSSVADPGENLTGALHSNFGHSRCGDHESWIYVMMLLGKTQ